MTALDNNLKMVVGIMKFEYIMSIEEHVIYVCKLQVPRHQHYQACDFRHVYVCMPHPNKVI